MEKRPLIRSFLTFVFLLLPILLIYFENDDRLSYLFSNISVVGLLWLWHKELASIGEKYEVSGKTLSLLQTVLVLSFFTFLAIKGINLQSWVDKLTDTEEMPVILKIRSAGEEGQPIPNLRFHLRLHDGSEISRPFNSDGKFNDFIEVRHSQTKHRPKIYYSGNSEFYSDTLPVKWERLELGYSWLLEKSE